MTIQMSLLNIPGKGWYIKDWWEGYNMGSFPSRQKARDWVKEMSGKSIGKLNKSSRFQTKVPNKANTIKGLEPEFENTVPDPSATVDAYLEQLEKERGEFYGDPSISHKAIGYTFRGILQNAWHHIDIPEIPDYLVAELLSGFKITRAARPQFREDSFDDAQVYTKFAKRFKEAKK